MSTTAAHSTTDLDADDDPAPYYLSPEESRQVFEEAVQRLMGMDGEEFIRRWEAGEYWIIADQEGCRHIGDLIGLIPFARQAG